MGPIKSIYLPKDALQGSEFPSHIIWEPSTRIHKIIITLPNGISLKEIYNVPKDGLSIIKEDNAIEVSNFEVNGYVGMVFTSKKLESPYKKEQIKFRIVFEDHNEPNLETREIILFRPEVSITTPQTIEISYNNLTDKYRAKNKIMIKNRGKGTAIIAILSSENSEIKIRDPAEFEEFIEKFIKDISKNFNKLKQEYPEQKQFIDEFMELFKAHSIEPTEKALESTKFNKKIKELLEKDEEFVESFINAIGEAYFVNLDMFMELDALLKFIKSSIGNNIFLLNPTSLLQIEPPNTTLSFDIYITDLAGNEYSELHSQCRIILKNIPSSKDYIRLPLHEIINMGEENGN